MKKQTAIVCLVAVLTFAIHLGPRDAEATSFFNLNQIMAVTSNTWNFTGLYNYNTGTWSFTSWHFGNNSFSYQLPYGAWFALLLWDDALRKWDEIVYVLDENR